MSSYFVFDFKFPLNLLFFFEQVVVTTWDIQLWSPHGIYNCGHHMGYTTACVPSQWLGYDILRLSWDFNLKHKMCIDYLTIWFSIIAF